MENKDKGFKKYLSGIFCLVIIVGLFGGIGSVMGLPNMLNTIMKTSHDLLLNTVFYLMAICVITGALGRIFVEFGVVSLFERLLRPLMKPLFNLPGVASLGAVMTFLSDNPAIISLAKDKRFSTYFKKFQLISLTNFGTAFGMGLLVIVFMISNGFYMEPFIGLLGAFIGCIVSTRLMQRFIIKQYPNFKDEFAAVLDETDDSEQTEVKETSMFTRILNSLLDGGKTGVDVGLSIIPGVLIISTLVMILTFGESDMGGYTGAAYEGVKFLPWLFGHVNIVFEWLFGFESPELMAFPITALGAVGAALGLVPGFVEQGWADGNAIAVFTAIGMCWSGYLSTHTAMLDALGYRKLTSKAILAHTVGGFVAGISAHWLFLLFTLIFGSPDKHDGYSNIDPVEVKIEYLAEGKVCTTLWVGDEFKCGRIFEDGVEDRSTDPRSMAWYLSDILEENVVSQNKDKGANYAQYSTITITYDDDMPEAMLQSLQEEVSVGLDNYRATVSRDLWSRGPALLNQKQHAKLEELIEIKEHSAALAGTTDNSGIVQIIAEDTTPKQVVVNATSEEDAEEIPAEATAEAEPTEAATEVAAK